MDSCYSVEFDLFKQFVELRNSPAATLPDIYRTGSPTAENEVNAEEEIPTIDFSLLKSQNSDERLNIIKDIGEACKKWGCFIVLNHDMPERLGAMMLETVADFFNLSVEEKKEYMNRELLGPVRFGTSTNLSTKDVRYWKEFLRVIVHPTFNSPAKPVNFREISEEYVRHMKKIYTELLRALWESLGLSEINVDEYLQMESAITLLLNNFYPPCPQPEAVLGHPPHTDNTLISFVMQSPNVSSLQVMHRRKWVPVKFIPNSLIFFVGDILEILSNGIYKSLLHRVKVNSKSSKVSVVYLIGTSLEAVVAPLPQLVERTDRPAAFRAVTYREYIELQKTKTLGKSCLDLLRL